MLLYFVDFYNLCLETRPAFDPSSCLRAASDLGQKPKGDPSTEQETNFTQKRPHSRKSDLCRSAVRPFLRLFVLPVLFVNVGH